MAVRALTLAHNGAVMADGAADARTDQPVMTREMSGDAADRSAAEAPGLSRLHGGNARHRDGSRYQHHDFPHNLILPA